MSLRIGVMAGWLTDWLTGWMDSWLANGENELGRVSVCERRAL